MARPYVLLVNDRPNCLHATEAVLQSAGYNVSTATNAFDAFLLMRSHIFDLLLLECIRDWSWIVREAKRTNPNIRSAVCLGNVTLDQVPFVDVVLYKPISPSVLLRRIVELFSTARAA